MKKVTRRTVLKGGTALVGGMTGILATGRAPAFAQGTTVHWIRWNDFVPASDTLLRRELLPEAEKALGIKINFETVNANDLQPRITSAIQFQNERVEELSRRHGELMEKAVEKAAEVAQQIGADLERKIVALEQAVTRAGGEATRIGASFAESANVITTAAEVTVARATAAGSPNSATT